MTSSASLNALRGQRTPHAGFWSCPQLMRASHESPSRQPQVRQGETSPDSTCPVARRPPRSEGGLKRSPRKHGISRKHISNISTTQHVAKSPDPARHRPNLSSGEQRVKAPPSYLVRDSQTTGNPRRSATKSLTRVQPCVKKLFPPTTSRFEVKCNLHITHN